MKSLSLAAAALLASLSTVSADARPFTAEDLVGLNRLGDAALSPDGSLLVFSMRETDLEADRGRTDLFRLDLTAPGAAPERWHADPDADGNPVFCSCGKMVYWLSGRSGETQVWRARTDGGAPEQITEVEGGISGFHLGPDAQTIVYWKDVVPSGAETGNGTVYDQLFVRQWDMWTENGRSQLFAVPVAGGEPVALTASLSGNVPTRPFGGGGDVAISADGKTVYFVMREGGPGEAWSTDTDIYAAPLDGSAPARNLTEGRDGYDRTPAPSPDGRYLAWLAMERPQYESDQSVVMLRDLDSGETRAVSAEWDKSADSLAWAPDGGLIVGAHDGWNGRLYHMDLDGNARLIPLPDGSVSYVDADEDGLLFSRSSLTEPGDLYWFDREDIDQLTNINGEKLADVDFSDVERFSFAGANGDEVFGYTVRPADLAEGAVAPTVLWSHGGPQGQWSNGWSSRWNPMVWAGTGYALVTVDFHGSSGYSQEFTDSINRDWGGKPLEDLQKGLAYARETFDFLDDDTACAAGASYGGFMMNWIEGNWPDEFACLVNHDGVFDMRSMYYTTEELFFPEWDFGGPYYENAETYERWNPVTHVANWKTPMLVIHGLKDYRVPPGQGLGAFTALQRRGIESRLLVFPDENHWVLKPNNSLQWHSEIFRWLGEHLED
ncbi:peptidase S9 [Pacificimonas flava]|uniref:Peptidase S9 n=2 Tax=Pacificimonas TaxID=1960290 RepID=A0A219B8A0_9SPHN|nr:MULTISPECIES: S9 family peptidase [Pacificimonas]MBZ6379861.1 S9 family peptidase [Pacificimonas aurantium]OWV34393.1 peptidase S9 [Pacificimonas flava]